MNYQIDKENINCYIGFDCTAESFMLVVSSNYVPKTTSKHGHRPIVLLGGGTTRIGDPSGKDKREKY